MNNTRQRKSKKLFLPLLIVAIVLASWLAFASIVSVWPFEAGTQSTTSTNQTATDEEQAANEAEAAKDKQDFLDSEETGPKTSTENTEPPAKVSNDPEIDLSASTQDNLLVVTTNLSTITSGTCTLSLQKGSQVVTKTAKVIFAPNSSTCEGFSINQSELGSGSWQITLSVKTDGDTVSKTINYTL